MERVRVVLSAVVSRDYPGTTQGEVQLESALSRVRVRFARVLVNVCLKNKNNKIISLTFWYGKEDRDGEGCLARKFSF